MSTERLWQFLRFRREMISILLEIRSIKLEIIPKWVNRAVNSFPPQKDEFSTKTVENSVGSVDKSM